MSDTKATETNSNAGLFEVARALKSVAREIQENCVARSRIPKFITLPLSNSSSVEFRLKSGETVTGRLQRYDDEWFLVSLPDDRRAVIAAASVERIMLAPASRPPANPGASGGDNNDAPTRHEA